MSKSIMAETYLSAMNKAIRAQMPQVTRSAPFHLITIRQLTE